MVTLHCFYTRKVVFVGLFSDFLVYIYNNVYEKELLQHCH